MLQEEMFKLDMVSVRLVKDSPVLSDHRIHSPEDAIQVMGQFLRGMDREILCTIHLKADGTPINGHIASMGALSQTLVHPREVLKAAILSNAANMLMLHCHPSGNLTPSEADIEITDRMLNVCGMVGIPLLDHIIVGGENPDYFSFRENEILKNPCVEFKKEIGRLSFAAFEPEEYIENIPAEREVRKRRHL